MSIWYNAISILITRKVISMSYRDTTKHCEYCGVQLVLNNSRDVQRKRFCSHACRQRWRYTHGDSPFLDENVRKLSLTPENIRKRNLPKGPKECAYCHQEFNPDSARQRFCKICVPDKTFRHKMQRYSISKPDWDDLLTEQNGSCALCDAPPYAVDHCHTKGHVRGLLCNNCNRLLGDIETDKWNAWYKRAIAYLLTKRHSG